MAFYNGQYYNPQDLPIFSSLNNNSKCYNTLGQEVACWNIVNGVVASGIYIAKTPQQNGTELTQLFIWNQGYGGQPALMQGGCYGRQYYSNSFYNTVDYKTFGFLMFLAAILAVLILILLK